MEECGVYGVDGLNRKLRRSYKETCWRISYARVFKQGLSLHSRRSTVCRVWQFAESIYVHFESSGPIPRCFSYEVVVTDGQEHTMT